MAEPHEQMNELQEHAEQGAHEGLALVSFSMAILAVLLAVVTLMGHRTHTEEIILHTKTSDQWAYYQAHNIRGYSYEAFLDQLQLIHTKDTAAEEKMREKYKKALEHEKERLKEISEKARELEAGLRARFGELTTEFRRNPALIGGLRVQIGNNVWDGSIQARLEAIKHQR